MLATIIEVMVYVAMGGVVIALVMGLGSMMSGKKNNKSNQMMRWRVGLQFVAIALLAILVFVVKK